METLEWILIFIYVIVLIIAGFILGFLLKKVMDGTLNKKPKNNVHFYVARDKDGGLWLYLGKPIRKNNEFSDDICKGVALIISNYSESSNFKYLGINKNDFNNLKWQDEPVEVFLNLENYYGIEKLFNRRAKSRIEKKR